MQKHSCGERGAGRDLHSHEEEDVPSSNPAPAQPGLSQGAVKGPFSLHLPPVPLPLCMHRPVPVPISVSIPCPPPRSPAGAGTAPGMLGDAAPRAQSPAPCLGTAARPRGWRRPVLLLSSPSPLSPFLKIDN